MNIYKNKFLHAFLSICLLFTFYNAESQCDCLQQEYDDYCNYEIVIEELDGTNITYDLQDAVYNSCRIRLANPTSGIHTYYTFPQVFRNIDHKEIILDAGVQLLGIQGGFSDCSQSVLTFDGNDVHDILIRGDYCEGLIKPLIGMVEANYTNYPTEGYLVGADNSGNPYLNSIGQPNYVFADSDADPYFDNNGDPNFITGGQQMVQKDCEYNDLLCNRKIVVWCPYSWEARHIIAFHGVENVWIQNLDIANASGGDGIHITDDRDFNVSSEIHLDNLDFYENARNGLKITNAYCVELKNIDFNKNGSLAPLDFVTPQAALNIDQNTSPGSVDDYMGTLPDYALHNITFEYGYFYSNVHRDISFDIPLDLNLCSGEAKFKANNVCILNSDDAVVFEQSNALQNGAFNLQSFTIDEFDNALLVENSWLSSAMSINFYDWTVDKTSTSPVNAFNINSTTFCPTATVSDICKSSNIVDNLCQVVSCVTPSVYCSQNIDPQCQGNECDLDVYTEVEEKIDYNCECDYLFMIDESGSVSDEEWEEMNCSITNMMNEMDSICMDSCDSRFGLIQWAGTFDQTLGSDFDCSPFEFERVYNGLTDPAAALNFLLTNLKKNKEFQPNKECLKVLLFTDANCIHFEFFDAGAVADEIKEICPNIEFIIVDYTPTGELADCEGVDDVIDDMEGEADPDNVIQSEFDCETGFGVDDIVDTTYTYTIHIEIDPECYAPTITWTAYGGGEIYPPGTGQTIQVNGEGYYTVQVECAFGCAGGMYQIVQFDNNYTNTKVASNRSAIVKKDRTRYYQGNAYTPHEFELLMLRDEEEVKIEHIQISPNPFADFLNIQIPVNDDNYDLKIFNAQGQMVYKSKIKSGGPQQIDLSELSNGLYIIKLLNTSTQERVSHKILKLNKN